MVKHIFVAVLGVTACSKSATPPPAGKEPAAATPTRAGKDPAAARASIAKGAVVIDVRTPDEFAEGHLANATNIAIEDFGAHLDDVDKLVGSDHAKPIVVYCATGARAGKAKAQLGAAGYTQVVNGGGYDDLR